MHPLVQILSFILIVFLINVVNASLVWSLCLLTCALAIGNNSYKLLSAVRRMKWLFISIFVIYAFGTPGEYVQYFPDNLAPTFEGVFLALLQIAKLLTVIAALIMLFGASTKEQLLSALNQLLLPLKTMGLNTDTFIIRLLLTLNYVESFTINEKIKLSFNYLNTANLDEFENSVQQTIELPNSPLKFRDKVHMLVIACIFLMQLITSSHNLFNSFDAAKYLS